jgi:alpha-maltose-1-phosphate synthase
MRVLLFDNEFRDYTIQLANALSNKNISVQIALSESIYTTTDENEYLSPKITRYCYRKPRLYSPENIILLYRLLRMITGYDPDIIHLQGISFWFSLALPLISLMKYPVIVTFHDPKPHVGESYLRTRIANHLARAYSARAFVHGVTLKELMMEEYSYPEWRTCVTISGEHEVMPYIKHISPDVRETGHAVLFFGRIYAYKGLDYLIRAEPLITREIADVQIIIAGKGEPFEKYRALMVHPEHFQVYNYYISYEVGAALFQKCSLVVLPYIDASQSGVVHIAYAFKKPVIVTSVGSIPEIVDDGVTGMIIPPKDTDALARAIVNLLNDVGLRNEMGEHGYQKLKTDLSWSRIVQTVIPVYEQVIKEKASGKKLHGP